MLPFLSLYPVLYCLTLVGSGRGFRSIDAIGAAIAGLVFAFVVNARTYAYWQAGPLLALVVLIVVARLLPWRLPLRARLARLSVYPVLVFALSAAILIQNHHWRRDAAVYDTATFSGHGYWLAYVVSTMPSFQWRIPRTRTGFRRNHPGFGCLCRRAVADQDQGTRRAPGRLFGRRLLERKQARSFGEADRVRSVAPISRHHDRNIICERWRRSASTCCRTSV